MSNDAPARARYTMPSGTQPNAENSDEVKVMKRRAAILHIRSTPAYQRYARLQDVYSINGIPEPDPTDLSMSKRKFETSVMQWRNRLRTLVISL